MNLLTIDIIQVRMLIDIQSKILTYETDRPPDVTNQNQSPNWEKNPIFYNQLRISDSDAKSKSASDPYRRGVVDHNPMIKQNEKKTIDRWNPIRNRRCSRQNSNLKWDRAWIVLPNRDRRPQQKKYGTIEKPPELRLRTEEKRGKSRWEKIVGL